MVNGQSVDLARYATQSTVKLTTTGRKSGKPRTVTIWFVVTAPNRVEIQHVRDPVAQWYKNLQSNPSVTLDFGDGPLPARATPITDHSGIDAVLTRIRKKHWFLGPLVQMGSGKSKPVAASIEIG